MLKLEDYTIHFTVPFGGLKSLIRARLRTICILSKNSSRESGVSLGESRMRECDFHAKVVRIWVPGDWQRKAPLHSFHPAQYSYFLIARKDIVHYTRLAAVFFVCIFFPSAFLLYYRPFAPSPPLFSPSVGPAPFPLDAPVVWFGTVFSVCPLYFCWNNSDDTSNGERVKARSRESIFDYTSTLRLAYQKGPSTNKDAFSRS